MVSTCIRQWDAIYDDGMLSTTIGLGYATVSMTDSTPSQWLAVWKLDG
jgi:hypothetical protein